MVKILVLGNDLLEEDSMAKRVGHFLKGDYEVLFVSDVFQLMDFLNSNDDFLVLDVVDGLKDVREISVSELKGSKIFSAHDFDSSFVFRLFDKKVKIIGIPMKGDPYLFCSRVRDLIS